MNILEKAKDNKDKRKKDKLPFAVFICPKANVGEIEDYKQIFTDIISDRIKQKYKYKIEQNFAKVLKKFQKYDINRRNKRDFKLFGNSEQLEKERYKLDENKMHLINKIFNNETIRTVWNKEEEKYYISIVDIVGVLAESKNPTVYWRVLKKRLKEEGNETVTNCNGLKLKAKDGKYRITDVCDIEGMFRIIESIPSKNAEPIKQWLAHLGKEKIDETFDPSIVLQRAIDLYRAKGYDEEWIAKRMKSIQERKKLTDVWKENGIEKNIEYAILTNEIYREWSGMTAKEYKQYKGLRKENLRDNMDNIELILTDLSEEATKRLAAKQKPNGLKENIKVAKMGGHAAKVARDDIEKNLGESVVTKTNKLNYKYIEEEEKQVELKGNDKKKLK